MELIAADDGLNQRLSTSEITTGAQAADQMNAILVEAIKATGAGPCADMHDGDLSGIQAARGA